MSRGTYIGDSGMTGYRTDVSGHVVLWESLVSSALQI